MHWLLIVYIAPNQLWNIVHYLQITQMLVDSPNVKLYLNGKFTIPYSI